MDEFHINDRVIVVGKNSVGTIAFIGNTHFSNGLWLGIILDQPVGRNNGSYEGIPYFKCSKNHGIFTRPCQVKKTSFIKPESEVRKVSSSKHYPNYLRDDSLSKHNKKHDSYAKKSILLKKVRKDIPLTSTSIPFFSSEGDVNLDGNNPDVKPKSMTRSEKFLPKNQFFQQEKEAKDSSPNKGASIQACELGDMTSKTSNELNEVKDSVHSLDSETQTLKDLNKKQFSQQEKEPKDSSLDKEARMQACELGDMTSKTSKELNVVIDNIPSLGRKTQTLKHFHENQFSQQEKEAKDSSSDEGARMQACEVRDMISKTSKELNVVKDNVPSLGRKTQTQKHFHENLFSQQEKEAKDSYPVEKATVLGCDLRDMISKTSKELKEVKDYVLNLDRKLKLLKVSLKEESSSPVEN
ncbi:Centrosome-associated protein 350 [Araneus ventricosus]|uniref:Centrosome-associated protein 350 n=1 Tax=Araneus ventricosus TaxID=182803 RepID=A0A4Y2F2T3_ARAVE|nr:Centrosome-associated protein 350 [Araneus ventricosus]